MPDKETIEKAREDEREGKSPSTQAGEFVREEMHHIREGKHGAASTKQAIAIGLSKARRAGVKLNAPKEGNASPQVRKKAQQDLRKGESTSNREPPESVRRRHRGRSSGNLIRQLRRRVSAARGEALPPRAARLLAISQQ